MRAKRSVAGALALGRCTYDGDKHMTKEDSMKLLIFDALMDDLLQHGTCWYKMTLLKGALLWTRVDKHGEKIRSQV